MRDAVAVRLLDDADDRLVERLAGLVNQVYAATEGELWQPGTLRTTRAEVAGLVAAGQIAVAVLGAAGGGRLRPGARHSGSRVGEFGMLAAAPERRGAGIGRALVAGSPNDAPAHAGFGRCGSSCSSAREGRLPHKEFLKAWYERLGYELVGTTSVAEVHPHLAALRQAIVPCAVLRYEKPLVSDRAGTAPRWAGW